MQSSPSQQPSAQERGEQVAEMGRQRPEAQISSLPQVWQAAPLLPQASWEAPGLQVLPAQQPPGQEERSQRASLPEQTPARQVVAPVQAAQAAPPVPQAALAEPGWQVVPSQQPAGQETVSQRGSEEAAQRPSMQARRLQQLRVEEQASPRRWQRQRPRPSLLELPSARSQTQDQQSALARQMLARRERSPQGP
ncbi:MAG: hypothetical protein ACKOWF_17965, partial [Chloroflexota bacterium]